MGGKRNVLRAGFGIVISLLVVATFTAYRIQDSFSKRTVEIHRHYVLQQKILNNLRRVLWSGGIAARDFFLNEASNRADVYLRQLDNLNAEKNDYFHQLGELRPGDRNLVELRGKFEDLFKTLSQSAYAGLNNSQEYNFIQEQIVPRRDAAASVLRQVERANDNSLTESEEQFTETRRNAAQRLVLMLGAGLLLGIAVTQFSLHYSENLEKHAAGQFEEVSKAKKELERLSARLMEIQEEERTRLSRELHDEIVQNLAVLKIEITQAQAMSGDWPAALKENLARARDLAERTVATVRNIMLLLRPSLLDDLGLGPALQWLTEDFRRRTRVLCEYREEGLQDDLPDAVKTCVYRVVQEALHNCEKHASANRVHVDVLQESDMLSVEVKDDGVGCEMPARDTFSATKHFGVIGMRERAASLDGQLLITSAPGEGTRISLRVPWIRH